MYEYLIGYVSPRGMGRVTLTRTAPLDSEAELVGAERFLAERGGIPSLGIFSFTLLSGPTVDIPDSTPRRVYEVIRGEYMDERQLAVFADKAEAQAFADRWNLAHLGDDEPAKVGSIIDFYGPGVRPTDEYVAQA